MVIDLSLHRFSVSEYYRMTEVGVLPEDISNELIDGYVLDVAPISPRHAACTNRLSHLLHTQLPKGTASIGIRGPVHVDDYNEPNADVALARFRDDYYREAHPTPADVLLIIEVADASLDHDSQVKMPLYAAAGVPEFWLVNLVDEQIEMFTRPSRSGYKEKRIVSKSSRIEFPTMPQLGIDASEILF